MSEYNIKLQTFEGPIALLMHLIDKNQIDIYDIPIAVVTEQYISYLRNLEQFDIEIASEFLVMAATLLLIKSRMLLPKPTPPDITAQEEDPRKELVDRLIEYRRFKEAAVWLDARLDEAQRYYTRMPINLSVRAPLPQGLTVEDLIKAFAAVLESSAYEYALIEREEFSIQEKMNYILELLRLNQGKIDFYQSVNKTGSRAEIVAAFLAMLELIKTRKIVIRQENPFGPIEMIFRE